MMCDLSMLFTQVKAFTSIWTPHVTKTDTLLSLARSPSTPCSLIGLASVNNLLSYWFSAWQEPVLLFSGPQCSSMIWEARGCLVLWQEKTQFLWSIQGWFVHVMLVMVKGNRKNSATQAASHTPSHANTFTHKHIHRTFPSNLTHSHIWKWELAGWLAGQQSWVRSNLASACVLVSL